MGPVISYVYQNTCTQRREPNNSYSPPAPVQPTAPPEETDVDCDVKPAELRAASLDEEYDTLSELESSRDDDDDVLGKPYFTNLKKLCSSN